MAAHIFPKCDQFTPGRPGTGRMNTAGGFKEALRSTQEIGKGRQPTRIQGGGLSPFRNPLDYVVESGPPADAARTGSVAEGLQMFDRRDRALPEGHGHHVEGFFCLTIGAMGNPCRLF